MARRQIELVDSQQKKKRSRDAARQRRGQQNDEFFELASHLPVAESVTSQLDRLCVMRLTTSFVKMKHIIRQVTGAQPGVKLEEVDRLFDSTLLNALGGFLFVVGVDGVCIYCSPNVSDYLGLSDSEVEGNSIYKYIHSCDQDELAKQLGGEVPLEDMEIFDGLFSTDQGISSELLSRPIAKKRDGPTGNYRSFFVRMKSTLTNRGKSVNLNASIYRVVHCVGVVQEYQTKFVLGNGEFTKCLLAVGTPLLSSQTFEVPLDRSTFTSTHMLDMKLLDCENVALKILGYVKEELSGKSWYTYVHGCDTIIMKTCHNTMLSKGQSVSGNYRLLTKNGGWVWVQTKGNVVYSSSTCQPQYIMCINHVISGQEARDEVLSTEQMPSVIHTTSKPMKRIHILDARLNTGEREFKLTKDAFPESASSFSDSSSKSEEIEFSGLEELEILRKQQSDYENKMIEEYIVDSDDDTDDDPPTLEFMDAEDFELLVDDSDDILDKDEELLKRAPFIPPPIVDEALRVPDCSLLTMINDSIETEKHTSVNFSTRAPFIPSPNIDTILTFDDLPLSPQFTEEGSDYPSSFCQNPPSGLLDDETDLANFFNISEKDLSMIQMGPSIVPLALLNIECDPSISSATQEFTASLQTRGNTKPKDERDKSNKPNQPSKHHIIKNMGKMSFLDNTCSFLPLMANFDCEINAPSNNLLDGQDLLYALDIHKAAT